MGCGASSISPSPVVNSAPMMLLKPVPGATPADVVQGSPVHANSEHAKPTSLRAKKIDAQLAGRASAPVNMAAAEAGGTTSDTTFEGTPSRRALIVQGLARAASDTIATNLVVAAGLATAAAAVAEAMALEDSASPEARSAKATCPCNCSRDPSIAVGFANAALAAAKAGSASAPGLTQAAIAAALAAAEARCSPR